MKHLHILMAVMTIAIFLYQFFCILTLRPANSSKPLLSKPLKIATHIVYTLLVIAGIMLVMPLAQTVGVPGWVVAKIVLFIVAISATIKATRPTTTAVQAKAGMVIALIAYIAIVTLAVLKPAIGFVG